MWADKLLKMQPCKYIVTNCSAVSIHSLINNIRISSYKRDSILLLVLGLFVARATVQGILSCKIAYCCRAECMQSSPCADIALQLRHRCVLQKSVIVFNVTSQYVMEMIMVVMIITMVIMLVRIIIMIMTMMKPIITIKQNDDSSNKGNNNDNHNKQ